MSDTDNTGGPAPAIPARSKRQAMEWSLVLASQDIAAIIRRSETGWELEVEPPELERAKEALAQYQVENHGWRWRQELPVASVTLHWGALFWAMAMVAMYYWSTGPFPRLKELGTVNSRAVQSGQWWLLLTGVTLHENLPHLMSNVTVGFLLLGLAMARYGAGVGLLAAFAAGVAGNYASVAIDPEPHFSLGASGMVTGALGLLTVQSFAPWRKVPVASTLLVRAVSAGILVLVLIGFSAGSDILAHVGGFVAGTILGLALAWVRPAALQGRTINAIAGLALGALALGAWVLACRK